MRPVSFFLTAILCALAFDAFAQGVGINGTGAPADPSAMLDVASIAKGFLPPRMTSLQRAAIVSPATGLLVYQSDGVVGFYYNGGTPASPAWQMVGSGAGSGPWSVSGANLYYIGGKVAVGATPSTYGLNLADAANGLRVQTFTTGGSVASFGGNGTFAIDAPGVKNFPETPGGRLMLLENGSMGLGNNAPTNPLSFASTLGKKISLYHDASGGDYGLGIESFRTKIYGGNPSADVALGYDNVGTFVEKLAVKPNGAIAVSGNAGAAGQVLQSNGAGAAANWASSTKGAYDNTWKLVADSVFVPPRNIGATVPGLWTTVNVGPGGAKALVHLNLRIHSNGGGGGVLNAVEFAQAEIAVDGVLTTAYYRPLPDNPPDDFVLGGTDLITLSPGTHTLEARVSTGSLVSVWVIAWSRTPSSAMVVQMLSP